MAGGGLIDFDTLDRARLVRTAAKIVGIDDAEDVVQDAMLRAMRGNFQGNSSPGTYVYRIVINTAINWLKRSQHRPLPYAGEGNLDTPDGYLAVTQALDGLAPPLRDAMLAGPERQTITTRTRAHRAKRWLQKTLMEDT